MTLYTVIGPAEANIDSPNWSEKFWLLHGHWIRNLILRQLPQEKPNAGLCEIISMPTEMPREYAGMRKISLPPAWLASVRADLAGNMAQREWLMRTSKDGLPLIINADQASGNAKDSTASQFVRIDTKEILMVSTSNMELEQMISAQAQEKIDGIRLAKPHDEMDMRTNFDKNSSSAVFSIEYLSEIIQWMVKSGATNARLTLKNDFPLMVEFESTDRMSPERRMASTTFFVAPIIDDKPEAQPCVSC